MTAIVPCGKCVKCLQRRQNAWAFRLHKQSQISTSACFITLTYKDSPITPNGRQSLKKKDYQNFIKRLRKKLQYDNTISSKQSLKYYACGEYGTQTKRPHYHAIMFNLPQSYIQDISTLTSLWGHGHVDIAPSTGATIRYVTKYIMKGGTELEKDIIDYTTGEILQESQDDRIQEFSLMSKKMGLNYLTPQMIHYHKSTLNSFVTLSGGSATPLPRYFRDKIFTNEEKKLINTAAKQAREFDFETLFDDCYKKHQTWLKNQIRKNEKLQKQERLTI